MINQINFLKQLKDLGIEFISGVPDTLLNEFCLTLEQNWPKHKHIIAANEGNSIALACGYHLSTGTIPLVYMQNSGIGNTINPILSLADRKVYSIPMILLIGWRGDPETKDHAQHISQGKLTPKLMDDMEIPYKILSDNESVVTESIKWAYIMANKLRSPVALIAKKNVFENGNKSDLSLLTSNLNLFREDVIEILLDTLPKDTIYVAATGRATRELFFLRETRKETHLNDFLNVGAMGHTSSIALGIAIAEKNRTVVCLDGDASTIMHLGALAVLGNYPASNLIHISMNNGVHESVGGQESVGLKINLTKIAKYNGYKTFENALTKKDEIVKVLTKLKQNSSPTFIEVRIRKGMRSKLPPLNIIPKNLKNIGF